MSSSVSRPAAAGASPVAWRAAALPAWAPVLGVCLAVAALAGAVALRRLGPEADWDLRNYHLYNGFALWQGRVGRDLAPAQLQSFLAPGLDLLYAAVLTVANRQPMLLGAILALPQGLAAFLAWCLARRLMPERTPGRAGLAAAAALIGVTGAAGLSTFAGAMSEMLPACALLGALLCLGAAPADWRPGWAGLLAGIAIGLKLTAAPFAVGLAVATLLVRPELGRGRARSAARFAAGALAGAALFGGAWWGWLWLRFGDPVFPYFNDLFHSPWTAALADRDTRFLPHGVWQVLGYPLFWAFGRSTLVSELPVRDPRIALGWIAAAGLAWRARREPAAGALRGALVVWVVGYGLCEALFSILRYLVLLEVLSGPLLITLLAPLLARAPARRAVAGGMALAVGLLAVTVVPDWGHAPPGPRVVAVRPPVFAPGSLVLLLDPSPMAYVAAFVPASVRFVGADNNLVQPGGTGRLARAVAAAIRDQRGPIWGLEEDRAIADTTLRAYGLARGPGCVRVRSNLDGDAIRACPLVRIPPPPG